MSRRARSGFTLIEVIASFGIALLMIGPIASIIGGVAGSFAGLERSALRRADLQAAGAVAMTASPLRQGTIRSGDYTVQIREADMSGSRDLQRAGWRLFSVRVSRPGSGLPFILETIRIGRL